MTGRFAPTPSGRMHIGNVYAMLGAWLSARKSGDSKTSTSHEWFPAPPKP